MDDMETPFATVVDPYAARLAEHVNSFGLSEFAVCDQSPDLGPSESELEQRRKKVLQEFSQHSPVKTPSFYSDCLARKFTKEISPEWNQIPNLINLFKSQIGKTKSLESIVYSRISKPEVFAVHSTAYRQFSHSISIFRQRCEAAVSIFESESRSSNPPLDLLLIAIRRHMRGRLRVYRFQNLFRLFRLFPLVRRKEIITIAARRLVDDLFSFPRKLPPYIGSRDFLVSELRRLSGILQIEFDLENHDGQHFTYLCQKMYDKLLKSPPLDVRGDGSPLLNVNPSFQDRLELGFIEVAPINSEFEDCFTNLMRPDEKYANVLLRKVKLSSSAMRELTRDRALALFQLRFIRNERLIQSIANSFRRQGELIDDPEFFSREFAVMRRHLTAAAAVTIAEEGAKVDVDAVAELILDMEDRYQQAKVAICLALVEVMRNLPEKGTRRKFLVDFAQRRPDLQIGSRSFLAAFELAIGEMELIANWARSLINLQILSERDIGMDCPVAATPADVQLCGDSMPVSPFEVFPNLIWIFKFLKAVPEMVADLTESLTIRTLKYTGYFQYAVWKQLQLETERFFTITTPQTYLAHLPVSPEVTEFMGSPLLSDVDAVIAHIESQPPDSQVQCALSLLAALHLGWKLHACLVKTDYLLPVYLAQEQESGPEGSSDEFGILTFANRPSDFSFFAPETVESTAICQHSFLLILTIATRFNNFKGDAGFINAYFGINLDNSLFLTKSDVQLGPREAMLRKAANLLFYEPEIFAASNYASLFCSLSHSAPLDSPVDLSDIFMPFAIRSEIARISGIERCFLKHYGSRDVFSLSSTEVSSIIDNRDQIWHFYVPPMSKNLALIRSADVLRTLLTFVSVRVQLLYYIRLDSYLSQSRQRLFMGLYNEDAMWNSPFFSRVQGELAKVKECTNIEYSARKFEEERFQYCAKTELILLKFMRSAASASSKFQLGPLQAFWATLSRPLKKHTPFIHSDRYIPSYLGQFMFQLTDAHKTELLNWVSRIEQIISDAVISAPEEVLAERSLAYSVSILRIELLRLGVARVQNVTDSHSVSLSSAVACLNPELFQSVATFFRELVDVETAQRLGRMGHRKSVEESLAAIEEQILQRVFLEGLEAIQMKEAETYLKKACAEIERTFKIRCSQLKPESYLKRKSKSSVQIGTIPPEEAIVQFKDELSFARYRFCATVHRFLTTKFHTDEEEESLLVYDLADFDSWIRPVSDQLWSYVTVSRVKQSKTWSGYLALDLAKYKELTSMSARLDFWVASFYRREEREVEVQIATVKYREFLILASLRDREMAVCRDQKRSEKESALDIRREFDRLVVDLQTTIKKVKFQFKRDHAASYKAAISSIGKILKDEKYIHDSVIPKPPPVIKQPEAPVKP
jgi:hypothetical protein